MDKYFTWLKAKVTDKHMAVVGRSYDRLFYKLYTTEFIFVVPFDENRLLDGLSLRREFSTTRVIFPCKCSVFEVLIALALRCEDQIMHDQKHGERSGEWFWEMLGNMGLAKYSDDRYDEQDVDDILHKFLYHEYDDKDTLGCAFRSSEHPDLSEFELFQQMYFHLNDVLSM